MSIVLPDSKSRRVRETDDLRVTVSKTRSRKRRCGSRFYTPLRLVTTPLTSTTPPHPALVDLVFTCYIPASETHTWHRERGIVYTESNGKTESRAYTIEWTLLDNDVVRSTNVRIEQ